MEVFFMIIRKYGRSAIMDNTHRIVQVKGHYEVHDNNGNFVLSGDTWDECYNDLVDMLVAEAKMENIREKATAWANMNTDIKDHISTEANL